METAVRNKTATVDEEKQRFARNKKELLNSPVLRKFSDCSRTSARPDP
jgi:hypothetical protein